MAFGLIKTLGLAGVALTAWYFLDPKKGAERRESFAKGAKDLYDNAGDEITRLGKNASEELTRFGKSAGEELSRLGKDIASGVTDTVGRAGDMVQEITGKASKSTETASSRADNHAAALKA